MAGRSAERRDHAIEVDLVGGDASAPTSIGFVGSVKWRENEPFSRRDLSDLARSRAVVPGAELAKLVVVSRARVDDDVTVDATFRGDELLAAS